MANSIITRMSKELWEKRRADKELIQRVLTGLDISEVNIDRIYTKKLRNINILDEVLKNVK